MIAECGIAECGIELINEQPRGSASCRPANQFKSVAAANAQIFRLDRHDGKDVRQIKNANQTGFAIGHFAAGFR